MRSALSALLILVTSLWIPTASAGDQCSGITDSTCNTVQNVCYSTLDLDPVSCGVFYGCCYKKSNSGDNGDVCRNNPCAGGCPTDQCLISMGVPPSSQSQGLTVGPTSMTTNVAPGASAAGMVTTTVAKAADGTVSYNWWLLGQGQRGWQQLDGKVRTDVAPAAALVGTYLFVAIKGVDGQLYLNQGPVNGSFAGWQGLGFQTVDAPAAGSSGRTTVIVARDKQGRVFYNYWELGQGGSGWTEIASNVPTTASLATTLVGSYLFVLAKGTDGNIYLNQGGLKGKFTGWQPMNFQSSVAVGATSAGTTSVAVARDSRGRVFYNWWNLGEGGKGWTSLGDGMLTDVTPAAALVGDYVFVFATGRDGQIHLNQGTLGKPFVGWH